MEESNNINNKTNNHLTFLEETIISMITNSVTSMTTSMITNLLMEEDTATVKVLNEIMTYLETGINNNSNLRNPRISKLVRDKKILFLDKESFQEIIQALLQTSHQ